MCVIIFGLNEYWAFVLTDNICCVVQSKTKINHSIILFLLILLGTLDNPNNKIHLLKYTLGSDKMENCQNKKNKTYSEKIMRIKTSFNAILRKDEMNVAIFRK